MGNFSLPENAIDTATDIWYGEFLFPSFHAKAQDTLQLKLNSDLKNLTIKMPAPLRKNAGEVANSTLVAQITAAGSDYQFNYGNHLSSTLKVSQAGDVTGSVQFSSRDYPSDVKHDDRFTVRGVIPRLSIDEWLGWLPDYSPTTTRPASYVLDVDVLIEELVWGTSTMRQVHFTVKQQKNQTLLSFDSEEIKGIATIPTNQDERIDIDLDHLVLKGDYSLFNFPELEAAAFPPIAIRVSRLKKNHFDIEDFEVVLSPASNGLRIEKINFNKTDGSKTLIKAHLEGNWTKTIGGDYSDFDFLLESDDYGQLLQSWGFYNEMKGGRGQIDGQLRWDNSPIDFKEDQLQGLAQLQISDGVLEAVDSRTANILTLLNIDALINRLMSDSENVSEKGLAFDSMQGNLEFQKADLIIKNLDINSPALDMKFEGRTNIVQEYYDQKITIIPKVGSNIKHAASFLASDIAYVASLLLNKVAELDKVVDKAISLEYTLKGSWDNPEIKPIDASPTLELD